jgi:hypothetical protein
LSGTVFMLSRARAGTGGGVAGVAAGRGGGGAGAGATDAKWAASGSGWRSVGGGGTDTITGGLAGNASSSVTGPVPMSVVLPTVPLEAGRSSGGGAGNSGFVA